MTSTTIADDRQIIEACRGLESDITRFLMDLVRFDSLPAREGPAMHWVHEQFGGLADICELVPVPESLTKDPDYQSVVVAPFEGRPNVRVVVKGDGGGRSVIFNAHVDVVPPSKGHIPPFEPRVEDGRLYGRGSHDDKGQVAVMFGMLKAMKALGLRPRGDVILHIVIEEETGGNGTLAMVRTGERADCCVSLDAYDSNIYTSLRGAVWFTATIKGIAGHSAQMGKTVSALEMAYEVMRIMRQYRDELLDKTRGDDPLFANHPNPMPLTFGELHAGDWPAMSPAQAVLKGVFGILTTPKEEVMRGIEQAVRTRGPEWLADPKNFTIEFPYRHDMMRTDPKAEFVQLLSECWHAAGGPGEIEAFPASSDAWFYNNLAGIPTAATGVGTADTPHTAHENIKPAELVQETAAMVRFIREWCGAREG